MALEATTAARAQTKRFIRRPVALLLAAALLLSLLGLSGCGGYKSNYHAVGFVHSNDADSAFMSFYSFEGTMVFRLKCKDASARIRYTAKLETGALTVTCVSGDDETALFTLRDGEEVQATGGKLSPGTVRILVKTDGKCENGDLTFALEV
ncbi:MAG: hypothetical protein IJK64_10795 [Clostridia bacterium]|nr:hypothetical protein [Clostridia bacterium]